MHNQKLEHSARGHSCLESTVEKIVHRLKPPCSKSRQRRTLPRGSAAEEALAGFHMCFFSLPRRESRRKLDPDFFASFTDVRLTVFLDPFPPLHLVLPTVLFHFSSCPKAAPD